VSVSSPAPSPPIGLAVDANVLVAHLPRRDGRALIGDTRLRLLIAEYTFAEFRHHVARRIADRRQAGDLTEAEADRLRAVSIEAAEAHTLRVPVALYAHREAEARDRVPDDPDDWHTAAVALAFRTAIWSEDRHFWGGGIAVWGTARLRVHLVAGRSET